MKEKLENNEYPVVKTLANKNKFSKRKLTLDEMITEWNKQQVPTKKKTNKRKNNK